jgi:TRAP-type mannitol/chloroaromatic compound transport system permease small subunit
MEGSSAGAGGGRARILSDAVLEVTACPRYRKARSPEQPRATASPEATNGFAGSDKGLAALGEETMQALLAVSRWIDAATRLIGQSVAWLIVAAAFISAGNAVIRKLFDVSSNAWLELQWWLFAAAFLLAAPWTLALNEHIRIDILNERFPRWARNAVEVVGHGLFLLPMAGLIAYTSWDFFLSSYEQNEQSSNFGGLPQWPVKFLIPLAFALLFVQGISELIKRIAIINGDLPEDRPGSHPAMASASGHLVPGAGNATPPDAAAGKDD